MYILDNLTNEKKSAGQTNKTKYYGGNKKYILLDEFARYINLNPQQIEEDDGQIENYHNNKGSPLLNQHEGKASCTKSSKSNSIYQISRIFSK